MKSITEMTDEIIDFAIENMDSETEVWEDEDGGHSQTTLSPKPELYTKLNQYFAEIEKDRLVELLKLNFNQAGS